MSDTDEIIPIRDIRNRIFTLRGVQVMLDKDLAAFYEVKPIRLREQVKRNIERFPEDFMFQLTEEEIDFMVSQNAIPSRKYLGGYAPYAFTEQGVAAVSAVIKSKKAVEVSILLMRAFVEMRKFIAQNAAIFHRLEKVELKQIEADRNFEKIFDALQSKGLEPKQGIFYDGQVFDAYKFVSGLIRKAKKSIILIDNYIDERVLDLFTKKKKNVNVVILTKRITKAIKLDEQKFNLQYPTIKIMEFDKSHDRFLIIDDRDIYHFGASLKDLGKKWFAFSKMDKEAFDVLRRVKGVVGDG